GARRASPALRPAALPPALHASQTAVPSGSGAHCRAPTGVIRMVVQQSRWMTVGRRGLLEESRALGRTRGRPCLPSRVAGLAEAKGLISDEHFTVEGRFSKLRRAKNASVVRPDSRPLGPRSPSTRIVGLPASKQLLRLPRRRVDAGQAR